MPKFTYDIDKTAATLQFILRELGGKTDIHKLFKILYFAESNHLSKYGSPIIGDRYIAMPNGPVPSTTYDILKAIRGDSIFAGDLMNLSHLFAFSSGYVNYLLKDAGNFDTDIFAESELDSLKRSINENRNLDFNALTMKSHDKAWELSQDDEMDILEIAKVAGANEEMLKYISLNIENQRLVL